MTKQFYVLKDQTSAYQKGDLVLALNQVNEVKEELNLAQTLDTSRKTIQVLYLNFFYEGPNRRDVYQILDVPLSDLVRVGNFTLENVVNSHLMAQDRQPSSFPKSLGDLDSQSRRRLLTQYMFFESSYRK
jgi:hypothetical protein